MAAGRCESSIFVTILSYSPKNIWATAKRAVRITGRSSENIARREAADREAGSTPRAMREKVRTVFRRNLMRPQRDLERDAMLINRIPPLDPATARDDRQQRRLKALIRTIPDFQAGNPVRDITTGCSTRRASPRRSTPGVQDELKPDSSRHRGARFIVAAALAQRLGAVCC